MVHTRFDPGLAPSVAAVIAPVVATRLSALLVPLFVALLATLLAVVGILAALAAFLGPVFLGPAILADLGALTGIWVVARLAGRLRVAIAALTALLGTALLGLLNRLVHRVDNAKIMLGVLEVALRHYPVPATGRVAAELQVFLEQLLRGAAHADIGAAAVKNMVAVQRDIAAALMANLTTTAATATAASTTRTATMLPSAHALHIVHFSPVALSC